MLVTEKYNLGLNQGGVDFVDVNVEGDVPVYIDPTAIRQQVGPWSRGCIASLQSFFSSLLGAISSDDPDRLAELVYPLSEPNETHLGVSMGHSKGRGLGSRKKAEELIEAFGASRAVTSGTLTDLEDTALMIPGIDKDIVSDMATCIIRRHLVEYTQNQCRFHKIPMELQDSGFLWDAVDLEWKSMTVPLPRAGGDKLVLVPKAIVRAKLTVDKGRYYRGYLRPYYEDEVLRNPTAGLVRVLKDKSLKVNLGRLDEQLGTRKEDIIRHTEAHPTALLAYKNAIEENVREPLRSEELAGRTGGLEENLHEILGEIKAIQTGTPGATLYHRSIARLLSALFTGALGNQQIETPLHGGLKRIDITYDNVAASGFFRWLSLNWPSAVIAVECKNYESDLSNPEFDQLAMRFSLHRGRFGILACRKFKDKERALTRAKAITSDDNGFVIVLDDEDLERLVADYEAAGWDVGARLAFPLLRERFQDLIA